MKRWTEEDGYSPNKWEGDQLEDATGSRIAYFITAGVLIVTGFIVGARLAGWWV